MKILKIALLFISTFLVRYYFGRDIAPIDNEIVKLQILATDFPVYSDSATIVRKGKWEIRIDGYTEFIPGDLIGVEGVVEKGVVVSSAEKVSVGHRAKPSIGDRILIGISYVRKWAVARLQNSLPEPMAGLATGILLGVKAQIPYDFYQALVQTGTLHIVAASGFNVMVVANLLMAMLGKILYKSWAIASGIVGIVGYVLLAGSSASVVRAGIMGSLTLIAYYFGRPAEARRLLWITAGIMLLIDPAMLIDVGFQLSVAATMGLLYVGPWISNLKPACVGRFSNLGIGNFLKDYFYPTIAATIATAPVIGWHFGRLSLIGVVANMLILPIVPLIMLLSAITLIVQPVAYLLYVPLWWVVMVIRYFA